MPRMLALLLGLIALAPPYAAHAETLKVAVAQRGFWDSTMVDIAEKQGFFKEAGLEWVDSGCSMCVGMNGDIVQPGERCASTTNRNFKGRQGPGARTHLMSPAMAAAAAVTGHLADVRPLIEERS